MLDNCGRQSTIWWTDSGGILGEEFANEKAMGAAMAMILVIRGQDASKYSHELDELYRLRYRTFVINRGWSLATRNERDVDQYDNTSAIYFILHDKAKNIVGSARVHDTAQASLLADIFPHLVETGEAPRGAGIYEGTRFIINPSLGSRAAHRVARVELTAAICSWCFEQGGTHLQAVVDLPAFQGFVAMAARRTRPLGLPHDYGGGDSTPGGGKCIAFRWVLSRELLNDFEAFREAAAEEAASGLAEAVH